MAQKIEVDILLKVFNVVSPQEKSQHLQNISSFVSLQKAFEKIFNQDFLSCRKAALFRNPKRN